jgi:hypothetical protein
VVAAGDDEVSEGEDDAGAELDVDGLDDGLSLADLRDDAEALGEADLLVLPLAELLGRAEELADLLAEAEELADFAGDAEELADFAGDAEELAEFTGDADELASTAPGPLAGKFFVAAESTVLFGISGQADLMIE